MENNNTLTLEQFKDVHYGKRGAQKRENLENGYENFKTGAMISETAESNVIHKVLRPYRA